MTGSHPNPDIISKNSHGDGKEGIESPYRASSAAGLLTGNGSDTPDNKDNKVSRSFWGSELFLFLIFTVLISGVTIWRMESANSGMRRSHEAIVKNNRDVQIQLRDSLLSIYKKALSDSTLSAAQRDSYAGNIEKTVAYAIDRSFDDKTKDLLEMEFSKIQNEYEVLNLWCALLTVVFLIFSFFSIFKTNEMTRQGEEALASLRATASQAKKKSANIEQQVSAAEERITKKEAELIKNLTEKITALKTDLTKNETELGNLKESVRTQSGIVKEMEDKKNESLHDIDEKVIKVEQALFEKIEIAVREQATYKMKVISDTLMELRGDQDNLRDTVIRLMARIKVDDATGERYAPSEETDDMDSHEEEPEEDISLSGESPEISE